MKKNGKAEKLYNMKSDEWRDANFKRGDKWRSTRKFECPACGCKSDKLIMGGWPGMGPRLLCPNQFKHTKLHDKLQEMVEETEEEKHPKKYIAWLWEEIYDLRKKISQLCK